MQIDLLNDTLKQKGDLVYSVGLIEHFEPKDTARMIHAHFEAAIPGGLVLITYPTPTLPYRTIRGAAEMLGVWKFHDERPLAYDEVGREMEKYGQIIFRKMNWFIGLTQEILVARVGA
ncbi:class I SAM-dependent methyltransferase [Phreatobacter aquaticus]|uniref:Class I SAM-dependent methyltransferase n=1 Tax=Phreatobacter aquaticus TaxID=2570229 RepID=A0A4D7QSH3_9HYPH|nr:class I SAM-dependent methyltransferase [Phreatobacter aquaticus]QCK88184.1 class I SAM-dependent methyltransferase [Phreatobacter aquaticus]